MIQDFTLIMQDVWWRAGFCDYALQVNLWVKLARPHSSNHCTIYYTYYGLEQVLSVKSKEHIAATSQLRIDPLKTCMQYSITE